jgi:hypothetical protein
LAVILCLSQLCKPQQWTNQKSKKQQGIQFVQTSYFHKTKENFDYFSLFSKASFVRPEHLMINCSDILRWFWSLQVASDHPMKITGGPSQQPNTTNNKLGWLLFV